MNIAYNKLFPPVSPSYSFNSFSERYKMSDSNAITKKVGKDDKIAKQVKKQFQLRRKIQYSDTDNEKVEEEINATWSFIGTAAATRIKVKGLTLKVISS